MPAFLTHWRVLIEAAQRSQDAGSDLGSLIIDAEALRRRLNSLSLLPAPPQTTPAGAVWDTGPLPKIDYRFPGSDISAMAFLGALAPDITNYRKNYFRASISGAAQRRKAALCPPPDGSVDWAMLLHTNRSGDFLLTFLEHIADIPAPALRSQALAFTMGYLSHIATDIALNPWINTLASAYLPGDIPGLFAPLDLHAYVELCLDEYIATTYFNHPLYSWLNQPWAGYIEPTIRNLTATATLTTPLLDLLASAAAATYGLTEEQSKLFRRDSQMGLHRLYLYLAGRGAFRWFLFNARRRRRKDDPIIATIAAHQRKPGVVTAEDAVAYAIRLSERLCRHAIRYYASLRNTEASAAERNQRRAALQNDLLNWDLSSGYTVDVTFDQQITVRFLHNWIYFAELWDIGRSDLMQPQSTFAE